jgi:hypothetical protein
MSSVQSFLRQRVVGTTTLSPPASGYYTFVADAAAGNYVGNYPPGYMVAATTPAPLGSAVLRDMGKTIKSRISSNNTGTGTFGTPGFFREVQVIIPAAVATATSASTYGVGVGVNTSGGVPGALPAGGNVGDDGYNTYYIPIAVGGVVPGNTSSPSEPVTLVSANLISGNVL